MLRLTSIHDYIIRSMSKLCNKKISLTIKILFCTHLSAKFIPHIAGFTFFKISQKSDINFNSNEFSLFLFQLFTLCFVPFLFFLSTPERFITAIFGIYDFLVFKVHFRVQKNQPIMVEFWAHS